MKIKESMTACTLDSVLGGVVCKVPDLGLKNLFMVVEDESGQENPIVLVNLNTGVLYSEKDLKRSVDETGVLIINGYYQQTLYD